MKYVVKFHLSSIDNLYIVRLFFERNRILKVVSRLIKDTKKHPAQSMNDILLLGNC